MVSTTQTASTSFQYNGYYDQSSRQKTSIAFLDLGSKLLSRGKQEEAMKMFDASFDAITSTENYSAQLEWVDRQLVHMPETFTQPSVDTYHEDECDVGPRPFSTVLVPSSAVDIDVLQLIICYNKALVHHEKKEFSLAMQLYIFIAGTLSSTPVHKLSADEMYHIAMRVYNNMGHIHYLEHSEEVAMPQFETALHFAKKIEDSSNEHCLNYAMVLSNWCRTQWMIGDVDASVYEALEEVLRIRFSVLTWDHVDVASAHYNLGMAEYSRECNDKAMSHFMQYLQVASCRLRETKRPQLDPIPALIFVLLIKNDEREEKVSQDLVWGLRTLQDKRQDLGPDNTEVASVLNFIGTLLFHQRELDYSLLFFQEELRLEEILIGGDRDVSISVTCNNIGRILQELGRFPQAIHYYQRSLRHKFGDLLTELESGKGKGQERVLVLNDAREDIEVVPATMNLYSTVWYNLGLIHDKMGAFTEAIKAFQMSLKLRRSMLGEDHADVACLLYNIGVLQMEQQLLGEATDSFREALRIRRVAATGQLNDRHVVKTLQKLASLHKSKGNITGALEACKEVMQVFKVSADFDWAARNRNLGSTLRDIAELYHAQGKLDDALVTAAESVQLLRTCNFESGSTESFSCVEQQTAALLLIGSLLHERCEPMEAHEVFAEASRVIQDSLVGANMHNTNPPSSLLPLLEVSSMLASTQCAPEA